MRRVDPKKLSLKPFSLLDDEWALLVAGTKNPSPMTISWGGFGTLWHRPVVTVYVRPSRHTYALLNNHPEFTVNFMPKKFRGALEVCGNLSGRDLDKWEKAKIHRVPAQRVGVPRVVEARLCLECRVLTTFDFSPDRFLEKAIDENYSGQGYHRGYIGEVVAICAESGRRKATPK